MKHSGSLKKCGVKPHFFVGKNLSKIFQLSIKPKLVQSRKSNSSIYFTPLYNFSLNPRFTKSCRKKSAKNRIFADSNTIYIPLLYMI